MFMKNVFHSVEFAFHHFYNDLFVERKEWKNSSRSAERMLNAMQEAVRAPNIKFALNHTEQ